MKRGMLILLTVCLVSACTVGPNYVRPSAPVPTHYKEASKHWKIAEPKDQQDRGAWWEVFNDPKLNQLETQVNISNQTVIAAEAQYQQARALVLEAQAAFFPTVAANASVTKQKFSTFGVPTSSGSSPGVTQTGIVPAATQKSLTQTTWQTELTATWELDIWGLVRRQAESAQATAQSTAALVAATLLSTQGTLAQDYFQLRALDVDQNLLDNTVKEYKKSLQLTQAGYAAGTNSLADIAQAQTQLKTAEAQATDNHINRAIFEHAIAVLIGKPPADFAIKPNIKALVPPQIPLQVPSELLERRPDIAEAERAMAAANASIGAAIAAYYPTLTLSGNYGYEAFNLGKLFSYPTSFWSFGPTLAETIIDGGLRQAQIAFAKAAYQQNVALYRQTVLAAFQDVEDNLVTLRVLKTEVEQQREAMLAAQESLKLITTQYQAGTQAYTAVIVAQNTAYTAEKAYYDIGGRQMVAAAGLIKALGGGWDAQSLGYIMNSGKLPG